MKLHEAIVEVLKNVDKPLLVAQEIADRINESGLYCRKKDDLPVPTGQITARINKYAYLFTKDKSVRPMLIGLSHR